MTIVHRTLDPADAQRAIDAGGPLKDLQASPDRLKDMRIAVVEVDGQIVAYWVIWYALHVEPLWVHDDWRKHPGVIAGIVDEMQTVVESTGEGAAFCVIEAENAEVVAGYAHRLGFFDAPGKLYYLVLQPDREPVTV